MSRIQERDVARLDATLCEDTSSPSSNPNAAFKLGEFYIVPCVRWLWCEHLDMWPVLGPLHEDARLIGFDHPHYHVDYRFLSARQKRIADKAGRISAFKFPIAINAAGKTGEINMLPFASMDPPATVELVRLRCNYVWPQHRGSWKWGVKLEDAYECARMVQGKCPHQGASLKGLRVVKGVMTCPLHGLRWNVETGELVRRQPTVGHQFT